MAEWTIDDIPAQAGRTVLVTGANSGLGLQSAEVLAGKGARVLLGCRSAERGEQALHKVSAVAAGPAPELVRLDLSELSSVREAAATVRELTGDALDVLINNAGLMAPPKILTKDGFESQFGTNYLGHAALTWLLMPALRGGSDARVVTLSSVAATGAKIHFEDPNFEHRRYNAAAGYGQSKLANQAFALELDRRLRAADEHVISVVAHPGFTVTGLGTVMARAYGPVLRTAISTGIKLGNLVLAQSVEAGALPQLFAATAPEVLGGDYIAPGNLRQLRGAPVKIRPLAVARQEKLGEALWDLTAELTGVAPDPV
jgi:NAD(P)-dependent dehydrogenase (short-subunit alcohol dehydrogenase family)